LKATKPYNKMAFRMILLLAGAILLSVLLVSTTINFRFGSFFTQYLAAEQEFRIDQLLEAVESVYDENDAWSSEALRSLSVSPYVRQFDLVLRDNQDRTLLISTRDAGMQGMHRRMMGRMPGGRQRDSLDYETEIHQLLANGNVVGTLEIGYEGLFLPTERDIAFIDGINQSILISALIALFITILAGYFLTKKMLAPLNTLSAASHEISRGKLNPAVTVNSQVLEWQELSAALSHLSASLKEQQLLRTRLTADISHELRTPLSVLQSHLEAFKDGIWEPTQERLDICRIETERLTGLVDQLQQLSSLEAAERPLNPESISLDQELEQLCLSLRPSFENKGILFNWQLNENTRIRADRQKIHQMVTNLLTNAMKYTDADGSVTLHMEKTKEHAVIRVSDTGIGISVSDQSYIFERFYRVDESRSRRSGGAGIGLSLVKAITEAHNGEIKVTSIPNQGSIFEILLPLDGPHV
jgi:two-component system, OmpR family, sensor histidine kinase BaeS